MLVPIEVLHSVYNCLILLGSYHASGHPSLSVCVPNHRCFEFSDKPVRSVKLPEFCTHSATQEIKKGAAYLHKGCTKLESLHTTSYIVHTVSNIDCFRGNGSKSSAVKLGHKDLYHVYNPYFNNALIIPHFVYKCLFDNNCEADNILPFHKDNVLYITYYEFSLLRKISRALQSPYRKYYVPFITLEHDIGRKPPPFKLTNVVRLGANCHVHFACLDTGRDDYLVRYRPEYCACQEWRNVKVEHMNYMHPNRTGFAQNCLDCNL